MKIDSKTHLLGQLHSLLVSLVLPRLRLPSRTPVDSRVDLVSNELGPRDVLIEVRMGGEVDLVAEEKVGGSVSRGSFSFGRDEVERKRRRGRNLRDLFGDDGVGRRSLADVLELDGSLISDESSEDVVDEGHGSLQGEGRERFSIGEEKKEGRDSRWS